MTLQELHKLTGKLLDEGHGEAAVAINFDTFLEHENGSILEIESAELRSVQGADDSGPVGDEYPFLVLSGPDVGETVAAIEAEFGTYPPASRTAESVLALARPMKIRIDKATDAHAWYRERIGQVIEVESLEANRHPSQGIPEDVYWVRTGDACNTLHYVRRSDATEVDANVADQPRPANGESL